MQDATKSAEADVDALTGRTTTGHEWDGIKELNTPLPRWWLWTLYLTIVWAVGYWVVYPSWPTAGSYLKGVAGYSSRADLDIALQNLDTMRGVQAAPLKTASLAEIRVNPDLQRIALARGKAAFGDNCAPCHGLGGGGAVGYPNLADDDWLWGGTLAEIEATITHGVRHAQDEQTRIGEMPAFGRSGSLKATEIDDVVGHVRSLAGLPVAKDADLAKGAAIFKGNCTACHGENAKGKKEAGVPDLTDAIWLYGSSQKAMVESVTNGRAGVMPAWGGRLDPVTIKSLAIYVHGLGGGQ